MICKMYHKGLKKVTSQTSQSWIQARKCRVSLCYYIGSEDGDVLLGIMSGFSVFFYISAVTVKLQAFTAESHDE